MIDVGGGVALGVSGRYWRSLKLKCRLRHPIIQGVDRDGANHVALCVDVT
jgi:hypothetical protein